MSFPRAGIKLGIVKSNKTGARARVQIRQIHAVATDDGLWLLRAHVLVSVYWVNSAVRLFDRLISDNQSVWVFLETDRA
jgi:hypothetical protein